MGTKDSNSPLSPERAVKRAAQVDSARAERKALSWLAMAAVIAMMWIASPVGVGILLGTLLAFSLQPHYEIAVRRSGRPGLTAVAFSLFSSFGLVVALGGLFSLLIARGMVLVETLIASLGPGGGLRELAQRWSTQLGPLEFRSEELTEKLHDAAAEVASRAAGIAAAVATTTFELLLTIVFAMMTLSFILRHWTSIALRAENVLPLRPRYTRAILEEFHRVGRTTLLGTVVTGVAQGALAALGYWITGVPEAAFFGALTAVASLIPGVGTLLIWLPAGVFLIATGHPVWGILELTWGGLIVVGASDYVIRPRLVRGEGNMPPLLTFVGLFGGVELLGLPGLLVGPLIMSVSYAVLGIFVQDAEERRALGERHA